MNIRIYTYVPAWAHMLIQTDTNICRQTGFSLAFISVILCDQLEDDKRPITKLYRNYWLDCPGYPSKCLYIKHLGHETHDKIAIIAGATLGLKSN